MPYDRQKIQSSSNHEFLQHIFIIWILSHLSFSATNQSFHTPSFVVLVSDQSFYTIDLLWALHHHWYEKKIRYQICDFSWYHSMIFGFFLSHILFCIINPRHWFLVHPFPTIDFRSGARCGSSVFNFSFEQLPDFPLFDFYLQNSFRVIIFLCALP